MAGLIGICCKKGEGNLEFRISNQIDLEILVSVGEVINKKKLQNLYLFPTEEAPPVTRDSRLRLYGMNDWASLFNPRQLLTVVTYVEIINEAKEKLREKLGEEKSQAIDLSGNKSKA